MSPQELRSWRSRNGFSQSQLAKTLGVITLTISRWERGIRNIPSFLHLALKWVESNGDVSVHTKRGRSKG